MDSIDRIKMIIRALEGLTVFDASTLLNDLLSEVHNGGAVVLPLQDWAKLPPDNLRYSPYAAKKSCDNQNNI
jgi:hypothetical protein